MQTAAQITPQTGAIDLLLKLAHVHGDGEAPGAWTFEDWEKLPDDGNKYEIIEGELYVTTSPGFRHNQVIRRLDLNLGFPAEQAGLALVGTMQVGLIMPTVSPAQPDFVLVLSQNADIIDHLIRGVPDLIIEVLSPGNRELDLVKKYRAYANAGVPEYGIIDPSARTLTLHRLIELGRYEQVGVYGEADTVTFACLPTIPLHIGSLFAGAPDTTV